jgi:hypothetical protein
VENLKLVSPGAVANQVTQQALKAAPAPVTPSVKIGGHVSRRGDVTVMPGEWLAGPEHPAQIEAVTVQWTNMPKGVVLKGAGTLGGTMMGKAAPFDAATGTIGTKGKATPLTGIGIQLSGPDAKDYVVVLEALFLGAKAVKKTGRTVSLFGPTKTEPLIGLRIDIQRHSDAAASKNDVSASAAAPVTESRVKIFRRSNAVNKD